MSFHFVEAQFEVGLSLLTGHRREPIEEPVQCLTRLQVVYEGLYRYASASEDERTTHNIGMAGNDLL
jgi:hypothetical protein